MSPAVTIVSNDSCASHSMCKIHQSRRMAGCKDVIQTRTDRDAHGPRDSIETHMAVGVHLRSGCCEISLG